jgi:hypothetical protein
MNFYVAKVDKRIKFSELTIDGLKSNDCVSEEKDDSRKLFPVK